ncbi:sugar transferase [Devosia sediminis]|uniref:Sugar transferase n=1 Tax=Devosia sediminis TaxID=2798801 RepID=A0A934MKE4_9HYPH|nr:sugar transferase [Devosia sediminis]MBJ3785058.1 sugar transferase [Devosia sediminis]
MIKFAFDTLLAAALLVILSPVIVFCMFLVRKGSPGPAIFRQTRVGRGEVPFTCYKLRTMQSSTANLPTHQVSSASVTPIGAFLRRSKLDELPQLINVLRGEMSFVGPRPCLPQQTELVEQRRARGVFAVRPGITGLAQIQDIDMSDPVRLATVDQRYVDNASFIGDIRIMISTVLGKGQGDHVQSEQVRSPNTDATGK